jgi:hypothetical protein
MSDRTFRILAVSLLLAVVSIFSATKTNQDKEKKVMTESDFINIC